MALTFTVGEVRIMQSLGVKVPPFDPKFGDPVDYRSVAVDEWYFSEIDEAVIQATTPLRVKRFVYFYTPKFEFVTDGVASWPEFGDWIVSPTDPTQFVQCPTTQLVEGKVLIFTRKEVE